MIISVGSCPTCCNAVPLKLCGELWYVLKLFHIDILLTTFQMNCANLHRHLLTFYFEWTVPIFIDILLTIFRMDCANIHRHFIDNVSIGLCRSYNEHQHSSFKMLSIKFLSVLVQQITCKTWTLFLAGKKIPLIVAVLSENCNVCM